MRRAAFVLVSLAISASLAIPASALAKRHEHSMRRSCHAGYVRRVVRRPKRHRGRIVRRHGHTVYIRRVECVRAGKHKTTKPKPSPQGNGTTTTPAPTQTAPQTTLAVYLDPTPAQSPTNPLNVVYSYSASASQTSGGVSVNLGQTGSLPSGTLLLYGSTSPNAPEGLLCATNVGGSATGSTCPVNYPTTGTFPVTVEYNSNGTTPAVQTDQETIPPYATTITAAQQYTAPNFPDNGSLAITTNVTGQGIGAITPVPGAETFSITDTATGQTTSWTAQASWGATSDPQWGCRWSVSKALSSPGASTSVVEFSGDSDCVAAVGTGASEWMPLSDLTSGQIVVTATYAGSNGWSASSTTQPIG